MFKGLSIHNKLVAMLMLVSGFILIVASVSYVVLDYTRFRNDMRVDLQTKAALVLDNTAAALSFQDPQAANETLDMLSIDPHVKRACLYLANGRFFSGVNFRLRSLDPGCAATAPAPGYAFSRTELEVTERLTRGPDTGASLYLSSDLTAVSARLRAEGLAVTITLAIGLLISFLLSKSLERIVSRPIAKLSGTARDIGEQRDFSLRAAPSPDPGDEIGTLVAAFNDMLDEIQRSQLERAELLGREQEANRLKDEFLATLSHELRTPLNAIVGWTHLLRTNTVPESERANALERIDRNAKAQARLVQDLLDVSRITTGKLHLDVREMDLNTVVDNAVDACRPAADARKVSVAMRFDSKHSLTIGDPDRLQQVVWNLVSNAVRFTPAGGQVTVSLHRSNDVDTLEVSDTGSGIDPAFVSHVFEPFRQADATATRVQGGLGLGLTIVRRLTEMHGGTVSAASEGPGKGATFTVQLPVRDPASIESTDTNEPRGRDSLVGAVVLLVDDDEDTLAVMSAALRSRGALPLQAASVAAALRMVETYVPDVVVSDIAMPGEDGYTLLALMQRRLGARMPAVTVAVTAYASERDRARAIAAGFKTHIGKPVDPAALLDVLDELMGGEMPRRRLG